MSDMNLSAICCSGESLPLTKSTGYTGRFHLGGLSMIAVDSALKCQSFNIFFSHAKYNRKKRLRFLLGLLAETWLLGGAVSGHCH